MNKELKEKIETILFAMTQNRGLKIDTIMEFSGDEYETVGDALKLAKKSDEQLNVVLSDLIKYFMSEEEK